MKRWFIIAVFLTSLVVWIYAFIVLFQGYEPFLNYVLSWTVEPEKAEVLRSRYLTYERYLWVRYGFILACVSYFVGLGFFYHQSKAILSWWEGRKQVYRELWVSVQKTYHLLPQKRMLWGLWLIVSGIRLWWMWYYPLSYDEVFIWERFVKRGLGVCVSYYPIHGNHLLQTLTTYILSFMGAWAALRLPSLIITMAMDALVFLYFYRRSSSLKISLIGTLCVVMAYVVWIHGLMGRGYAWGMFFCVTAFVMYRSTYFIRMQAEWILCNVLALYALPSSLFFLVLLHIANVLKGNTRKAIISVFAVGFLSFLLYLPILLMNDFNDLFSGAYYQGMNDFIAYCDALFQIPLWWGLKGIGVVLTTIAVWLFLYMRAWIALGYLVFAIIIGATTAFPAKGFMPLIFFFVETAVHAGIIARVSPWFAVGLLFLLWSHKIEYEQVFGKHHAAYTFAFKVKARLPNLDGLMFDLSPDDDSDMYVLMLEHAYGRRWFSDSTAAYALVFISTKYQQTVVQDANMAIVKR